MYLIEWVDWKTQQTFSLRLSAKNVARFIAVLISDVKPNEITIKPAS